MKDKWKKLLAWALCAVLLAAFAPAARAVETESVVTRDDGVWLFPLPSERYHHFTDWAGCHGMQDCPFHGYYCGHGDNAHGGDPGGHQGIDVGADAGTAVMAAASGTYYAAPYNNARGNYVVIEHPLGNGWSYYSCYQHLSAFGGQTNGAWVNAGDKIGEVGSSGYSFGAHLHFGLTLGASGEGVNGIQNERSGDSVSEMWVRTPGLQRGRIVTNPSVNSPAGVPTGDYESIALHAGSVRYTFDKNSVSVGESASSNAEIKEGSYRIRNGSSYLSADNDSDGGDITAKAASQADNQLFEAIKGNGSYTFRSKNSASGRMLNVYTADASRDGNKITLWQPTGHATQAWILEQIDGNRYKFHPSDNVALSLTLENDRPVLRSSKSGDASQIWILEGNLMQSIASGVANVAQQMIEASKSYLAEGAYRIHNGVGYLSARDDSDGGDITIMNATKTKSQLFYAVRGDGSYTFRSANSASGRMLNVYTADASRDGNKITLWQPTGHATQAWTLERVDGNRYVLHPSDNASLALTMELKDASQNIYAPVLRTYKSGDKSQIWTFDKDFKDANENAYYYQPLQWASVLDILGSDSDMFSPNANCPRAQMVFFMWRAAGSPEPKSTSNPFTDVKSSDFYYKAVLWAVENGITKGTTATTFSPNATVTRGQAVTLMYRFAKVLSKASASSASGGYSDVKPSSFCYEAVNWASSVGITKGTTATTFSPSTLCSRSHIVTFLYRFLDE